MSISELFGLIRRILKLRQDKLAKQLNVSRLTVARYEAGIIAIPAGVLLKFAKLISIAPEYLIYKSSKLGDV